jgi:LPS export ABC transporter protein LptC/lipopolysaccharide transport protein LptA
MERIVKTLRIALPILFIGFIAVLVLSFNRAKTKRDKTVNDPVNSTMRPADRPQIESKTFDDTQTLAGRVVSHIRADRAVAFASGWNTLEKVELTIYRANGLTYELTCPEAQFNSKTKEAEARGGVRLVSSDGIEITTAEIKFDGNKLQNRIPVQFKVDAWNGKAGGLDLDVAEETLRLFDHVDAVLTPSRPAELPMTITAEETIFRRRANELSFTGKVLLTRLTDNVRAESMLAHFGADRKTLVGVEGTDHVIINLAPGSQMTGRPALKSADTQGARQVTCDRFFTELGGDGHISAWNGVGVSGPAHAMMEGPPRRDMTAKSFRVALRGNEVTEIQAENKVVMTEAGPTARRIDSEHMTVYFDPATRRASSAAMTGGFRYHDPKNTATAARANYDITNDKVILTSEQGSDPEVISDGQTLKAKTIELSPKAASLDGRGSVIAQLISKQSGTAMDSSQLFPAARPVFVNSDSVSMRQATKTAVFTGSVRAWQDTNTLFAQELQVLGNGDQITARGGVRTLLYNAGSETRKVPILSRSDGLMAHKNERKIELMGNVQIDDDLRTLTSDHASFFFDANKKIERVEAETKVVLVEKAAGRRGTGDRAVYQLQKKMIYLSGNPAKVTDPKGSFTGQQLAFDLVKNKVDVVSPTSQTEGSYKP